MPVARHNPSSPVEPWIDKAMGVGDVKASREAMRRAYDAALATTTAAHNKATESEQEDIRLWDSQIYAWMDGKSEDYDGNPATPEPFIAWAQTIDPSLFQPHERGKPRKKLKLHKVKPVQRLEGWLPDILYHGSQAPTAVLTEGICVPEASEIGGDWNGAYTWIDENARQRAVEEIYQDLVAEAEQQGVEHEPGDFEYTEEMISEWMGSDTDAMIEWAWYTVSWYKGLSAEGRASLWKQGGVEPPDDNDDWDIAYALSNTVSLFWTSATPTMAGGYNAPGWPVFEIAPYKLSIYGFFEPDVLGRAEIVLVLPNKCPQGLPDAVVSVYVDDGSD